MVKKNYMVSAIVSVYNCERFIAGCLEDLERQTIADKLEIVVVNTGSQQNEEKIIKDFQEKFDNIVYVKTENRETLYQAWNRGIKAASGKYITNANSDDRHRKDALEIMANFLENEKCIDLVYYDFIITETENETFENCTAVGYLNLPEFDPYQLVYGPFVGHQPMWRKGLHEEFGYFDGTLEAAGDYEFWLRITEKSNFKHIKKYLGLYLRNPNSAERRNHIITTLETENIVNNHILRAANNKKLLDAIKRRQSERACYLGHLYLQKKHFFLTVNAFFRSLTYSWYHLETYKRLLIRILPEEIVKILIKVKKCFFRKTVQLCQK